MSRKQARNYTRFPAIPVPADCRVRKPLMQVVRYYRVRGQIHYHLVGQSAGGSLMHANDAFRFFFPGEWDRHYGHFSPSCALLRTGLYAFALGAGWTTGVYPALARTFSDRAANILMDLAMFLVRGKASPFRDFAGVMADHVLFSRHAWPWEVNRKAFAASADAEGQAEGETAEQIEASLEKIAMDFPMVDGDGVTAPFMEGTDEVDEAAEEDADVTSGHGLDGGELEAAPDEGQPLDKPDEGPAEPAFMTDSFKDLAEAAVCDFLSRELGHEAVRRFFDAWMTSCVQAGAGAVWLFVDRICDIPVLWAVDERDGMPLAIETGSSQSLAESLDAFYGRLVEAGLEVRGVLLDEALLGEEDFRQALNLVRAGGLDCVVCLKEGGPSFERMLETHARDLEGASGMDPDRLIVSGRGLLFGTVGKSEDFGQDKDAGRLDPCTGMHAALYSSPKVRAERAAKLVRKIRAAQKDVARQILEGVSDIVFSDGARDYLRLLGDEEGRVVDVAVDKERWQKAMTRAGHFALASENERGAGEILDIWTLAPAGTCLLSGLWERLGASFPANETADEAASHPAQSPASGFPGLAALALVAALLRRELEAVCDRLCEEQDRKAVETPDSGIPSDGMRDDLGFVDSPKNLKPTPDALLEALEQMRIRLWENGEYLPEDADVSDDLDGLLQGLGIPSSHQRLLASDMSMEGPDFDLQTLRGLPGMTVKTGRGRRRGSKNRATLEREALLAEMIARGEVPPTRRPGRPKSQKRLEREALEAEMRERGEEPPKPRRGRPKGSKNRATLEREALLAEMTARGEIPPTPEPGCPQSEETLERDALETQMREHGELPPKRRPGRPKSQQRIEREALEAAMRERGIELPKPRRGRPKGSRNKKTLEREAIEAAMMTAAQARENIRSFPDGPDMSGSVSPLAQGMEPNAPVPVADAFVKEAAMEEASVTGAPGTNVLGTAYPLAANPMGTNPMEAVSPNDAVVETTAMETAAVDKVPMADSPTEAAPAEAVPGEIVPGEVVSGEHAPGETTPMATNPLEANPMGTNPVEAVSPADAVVETAAVDKIPMADSPTEAALAGAVPGEVVSGEPAPDEAAPKDVPPTPASPVAAPAMADVHTADVHVAEIPADPGPDTGRTDPSLPMPDERTFAQTVPQVEHPSSGADTHVARLDDRPSSVQDTQSTLDDGPQAAEEPVHLRMVPGSLFSGAAPGDERNLPGNALSPDLHKEPVVENPVENIVDGPAEEPQASASPKDGPTA